MTKEVIEMNEREVNALTFSQPYYDDCRLLGAAVKWLRKNKHWMLSSISYQNDDWGSHLTLYLSQIKPEIRRAGEEDKLAG